MSEVSNLSNPGVSIILPTYNRTEILRDTLNSIVGQTYMNWELIIIDDGSDIDIKPHVENYVKVNPNIRYYRNIKRRGLPASRNVGLVIAQSDIVLFIEDDIILERNALELLVRDMAELSGSRKVGAIAPSIPRVQQNGNFEEDIKADYEKKSKLAGNLPFKRSVYTGIMESNFSPLFDEIQEVLGVHACCLYDKKAIIEVGGYNETSYVGNYLREESDLNIRLSKKGYRFYFDPKSIFYHVSVSKGGCRTSPVQSNYYYIHNHTRYIVNNFGPRAVYMLPLFYMRVIAGIIKMIKV